MRLATEVNWKKLKLSFLILNSILFILYSSLYALTPPTIKQLQQYKTDGTFERRLTAAKILGNNKISSDLFLKTQYKLRKMQQEISDKRIIERIALPSERQGMPTKGSVKILILLVEFNDYAHKELRDMVDFLVFGEGIPAEYPYESVKNYYKRSSYNQLDLTGEVLAWYKAPYNRDDIATAEAFNDEDTRIRRENLIKEIFNHYKNEGDDFSKYDNNNDGYIDYFSVIWTGPSSGWGKFWWPFATKFQDSNFSVGEKKLKDYSWVGEKAPNIEYAFDKSDNFTPRVLIHETGHALGLPDYYDYNFSNGGLGALDIMDGSWGDHNCFSKFMLDWIAPKIINEGEQNVVLNASGTSQDAVIVMPNVRQGETFKEFFMVQNRYRNGNDDVKEVLGRIKYPADGLLIWHVDATLNATKKNFKYSNTSSNESHHKLLRLMEADGLEEIEKKPFPNLSIANAGDYYVKGKTFTPKTFPNSNRYNGSESEIYIDNISDSGTSMNARFYITDTFPPAVSIISLNGSEAVKGGSATDIKWTATDDGTGIAANGISIYYSKDGGQTFTNVIASGIANSGTYSWLVPKLDLSTLKIRITASDAVGNIATKESQSNFTIDSTAPEIPTFSPIGTSTNISSLKLSGGKSADSAKILINGSDAGLTYPSASSWEKSVTLSEGENTFTIIAQDLASNESNPVSVKIVLRAFAYNDPVTGSSVAIPIGSSTQVPIVTPETYTKTEILVTSPPARNLIGSAVDFKSNVSTFIAPISITMKIPSQAIYPLPFYWDETSKSWSDSGIKVISKTSSTITFTTTHLSVYAIFDISGLISDIAVYPNPFKIGSSPGIIFDGLKGDETIKIYTILGELIFSYKAQGESKWTWDIKNIAGNQTVQNICIYLIKNDSGQKRVGRIAITN